MKMIPGKLRLTTVALALAAIAVLPALSACGSGSATTPSQTTTTTTAVTTTPPVTTTTTTTTSPTATTTTPPTTTTTTTTTAPTTTTTTTTTTSTTATTTAAAQTFDTLASAGQTTYNSICASCHGKNGGGSQVCPVTIWGTDSTLGTYSGVTLFTDAAGMYNYVSKRMPLTNPGSLTSQQYDELLAYILIKAGKVSGSTTFDQNGLSSISIP